MAVADVLGIGSAHSGPLSLLKLMSEVERGLPLTALDRVVGLLSPEITIPNGIYYEAVEPAHLPGWDHPSAAPSRASGAGWQQQRRSLILLVPSVIARMARNILLNPYHPEFHQVTHGLHRPVWWDGRLFTQEA